jgi:cytochrome P450
MPPGPVRRFGGLPLYLRMRRDLLAVSLDLQREYGDIVYYRVGPVDLYQFSHPDHIAELLVERAGSLWKVQQLARVFRRQAGNAIAVSEGAIWLKHRRMVQAALQQQSLSAYVAHVVRHARGLFRAERRCEVDLVERCHRLTTYNGWESVAGTQSAEMLEKLYRTASTLIRSSIRDAGRFQPPPLWVPTPGNRRFLAALRHYDEFVYRQIAERRRAPKDDAISRLMAVRGDDGSALTDREVRDEAVLLVNASKDTTASAMVWAAYALATHPEAQERAAGEVDEVLQGGDATADDLPRLAWLGQCVKESMRLRPASYLLAREANEDFEICGYPIRRGAILQAAVYAMHHDPRWFDEPDAFRPERFSPSAESSLRRHTYLPFGVGPRICVGKSLGFSQLVAALATLLQEVRLSADPDAPPPACETNLALQPRGAVRLRVEPRRMLATSPA